MTLDLRAYTESNRQAWNEAMPKHRQAAAAQWDSAFMQPGFVCLDVTEQALLRGIAIEGKDVAHLCCNNGRELLSLKNMGAGRCVGFDISDEAITEAHTRAQCCGIDCTYVRSDVYDIGPEYDGQFDVVYVTCGGLGWLPDLKTFFARASAMLRRDGCAFIHEIHPVCEMLPFDDSLEAGRLQIVEPYFKAEPYIDYGGLDYVGHTEYSSTIAQYWFVHTLSDIFMALIDNHICIQHFSEYEKDISAGHARIEEAKAGVPLSYILIGRKGAAG